MTRPIHHLLLGSVLGLGLATAAIAVEPIQQHNSNAVWFENWIGLSNATLVVAAPNGKITQIYSATGTPVFELSAGSAMDGVYRYELRAATEERIEIVNPTPSLRGQDEEGDGTMAKPFYTTGFFVVERGAIITPEYVEEESDG